MQTNPILDDFTEKGYIDNLKNQYKTRFPHILSALKAVDAQHLSTRKKATASRKSKTRNTAFSITSDT
jgi:hypothetical protein